MAAVIGARRAPPVLAWMRANLFSSIGNGITTLVILYVLYRVLGGALNWLVIDAVWDAPNMRACHADGYAKLTPPPVNGRSCDGRSSRLPAQIDVVNGCREVSE